MCSAASLLVEGLGELLHVLWSVGTLESKLLIEQERLEDGIRGETEDSQESVGDHKGEEANEHDWGGWVLDIWGDLGHGHGQVGEESIGGTDSDDTEASEDGTNIGGPSESGSIGDDKRESVPCSLAEVVVGESNLDVSVLGDELDALLKEIQEVAGEAKEGLDDLVVL